MSKLAYTPENLSPKIKQLEIEQGAWQVERDRSTGRARRLAQTALTELEARLKWYRGRVEGKKPETAFTHQGRKATKRRNAEKLAEVRP